MFFPYLSPKTRSNEEGLASPAIMSCRDDAVIQRGAEISQTQQQDNSLKKTKTKHKPQK